MSNRTEGSGTLESRHCYSGSVPILVYGRIKTLTCPMLSPLYIYHLAHKLSTTWRFYASWRDYQLAGRRPRTEPLIGTEPRIMHVKSLEKRQEHGRGFESQIHSFSPPLHHAPHVCRAPQVAMCSTVLYCYHSYTSHYSSTLCSIVASK